MWLSCSASHCLQRQCPRSYAWRLRSCMDWLLDISPLFSTSTPYHVPPSPFPTLTAFSHLTFVPSLPLVRVWFLLFNFTHLTCYFLHNFFPGSLPCYHLDNLSLLINIHFLQATETQFEKLREKESYVTQQQIIEISSMGRLSCKKSALLYLVHGIIIYLWVCLPWSICLKSFILWFPSVKEVEVENILSYKVKYIMVGNLGK